MSAHQLLKPFHCNVRPNATVIVEESPQIHSLRYDLNTKMIVTLKNFL